MTDLELISLAHTGDARATDELVTRYIGLSRHIAARYYYPGAEFEDVAQEALLGLLSGIRTWNADRSVAVKPYLVICMERMIVTGLLFHRRRKHRLLNEATSLNVADRSEDGVFDERIESWAELATGTDPLEEVIASETLRELVAQVNALSSLERSAVVGLLVEGKSYRLLAAELGCGEKSVDNAVQRARRQICGLAA